MRRTPLALACLLAITVLSSAQKVGDAIPYNSWAKYPLLNTNETVTMYGDTEVSLEELKKRGIAYSKTSVMRLSTLCKNESYSCMRMSNLDEDGAWFVYAVDSVRAKEKVSGTFELKFFVTQKGVIDSSLIYLPPRAETGLTASEIRFIDVFARTFTGQPINKVLLNKCYWVNKDDMREKCVVQSPIVNGRRYQIVVNFLNLDHEVGKPSKVNTQYNLRSFSVKILPVR